MDAFVTWSMLQVFASLNLVVYVVTEFSKEMPYIKLIKTKYYSAIVAFVLILLTQIQSGTFVYIDIVLYALSAMVISLGANGISDFGNKVDKTSKE